MLGGNINPSAGAPPTPPAAPAPDPMAGAGAGDGFSHYTVDQNESGFHSTYIDPSGQQTDGDHATADEAMQQGLQVLGGQDQDAAPPSPDAPPADDSGTDKAPDFSAAYSK